jgi:hypothetical protein
MTKRFLMAVSCAVFAVSTVTAQKARSPKPADKRAQPGNHHEVH